MSFNTFGKIFRFTTWGESHGPAIGCIVDGCPPNISLSEQDIQKDMNRRRPGNSKFVSQRKESDRIEILSENKKLFIYEWHVQKGSDDNCKKCWFTSAVSQPFDQGNTI